MSILGYVLQKISADIMVLVFTGLSLDSSVGPPTASTIFAECGLPWRKISLKSYITAVRIRGRAPLV